jgi:hypothetical protein
MAEAFRGSTYKFKQIETAYDSLKNVGLENMAEMIEELMAGENYVPKLVGNKWKFRYMK